MVLVFFGFVATVGSAYVQVKEVPAAAWWGSLVVGLLACAILARQQRARRADRRGHGQAHARGAGRGDDGAAAVRRLLRRVVRVGGRSIGITAALGAARAARAPARGRAGAHDPHAQRSRRRWSQVLVATSKVEVVVAVLVSVGLCLS